MRNRTASSKRRSRCIDEKLDSGKQEAVIGLPLPILDPLMTTTDGKAIAVVYLARSADGSVSDFEPFVESYRQHDAGMPHDLIIVRKGLHQLSGSQAALTEMLNGIPHRAVDVLDDGFDIQAYLKVTPYLRHDRVCFLNTFRIASGNWLSSLNAPLDRGDVGMSGATGSYREPFHDAILPLQGSLADFRPKHYDISEDCRAVP